MTDETLPGLSSSDKTQLQSLIDKEISDAKTAEKVKSICNTKLSGLAMQLIEINELHPDAVAQFLAKQPEFKGFAQQSVMTADEIRKFVPPHWNTETPTGIPAAAKYLEATRVDSCIEETLKPNIPDSISKPSGARSK